MALALKMAYQWNGLMKKAPAYVSAMKSWRRQLAAKEMKYRRENRINISVSIIMAIENEMAK
jgi:hypothetical protein